MAVLYDHLGREIRKQELKEEQAGPQLTGTRQVVSGHPAQGLTPGRLASILREAEEGSVIRYMELAEEMEEKDLHYHAVLGSRKRSVAQLEITVEAASDGKVDVDNADFVREWLNRDELEDDLFDILDAIGKGYSLIEIIWDMSENQWWPARTEWRDPRWFELSREDGKTPMLRGENGLEPLRPFKFIHHVHRAKSGLPIRSGLARIAAWIYMFKNYGIRDWVSFAEIFGMPFRIGKYGPEATGDQIKTLRRAVAGMSVDASAIIPKSMDIELVGGSSSSSGGGGGGAVFKDLANYFDTQMSKAVLGQTTTTDAISGGHAVSKEHDEVRREIIRSDAKQLATSLNRDLVRPLIDLNRGPQKKYPRINIGLREATDIDLLSKALERLVPQGLQVEQSVIRDKLGLPDPKPGADVLRPPAATPGAPPPPAAQKSLHRSTPAHHDDPARIADDLDSRAMKEMNLAVGQINEMLSTASSLEEFRDRLLSSYPDLSMDGVAAALRDAMVLAEMTGRGDIIDQD